MMPNMIGKELLDEMNQQIVEELQSAYIYMGMSVWAEMKGLHNFAQFMQTHAEQEEYVHAMKFVHFIQEAGGKVEYGALEKVSSDWPDVETVLKEAIKHEQHITARIKLLWDKAHEENEIYAYELLTWFLEEQMEEENLFEDLLTQFELTGKRLAIWDRGVHHPE
ncbi:ferritin [Candidatus Bathyarchaeota archaeon]|nr:ferritin [Candidatus Bathyarchaeota archaeon]